jgi:LacI family transcriptional regulator
MQPKLTLQEVARRAGVDKSTASRALNPQTRSQVKAETAERVLRVAKAAGYLPNGIARGLRIKRSYTVGILVPDITNPFFPPVLRGLDDVFSGSGYQTLIANTDDEDTREESAYHAFIERQVDGLVVGVASFQDELLDSAINSGIPVVLLNRQVGRSDVSAVCSDDENGISLAVEHLASLGHRSIAHVAGRMESSTGYARHRAFTYAMESLGLHADPDLIVVSDRLTEEAGERATLELLRRTTDMTAIVAATDMLALGCYDALEQSGLTCPDDISVVGHNDVRFADKVRPPLTTVRVPQYQLGTMAARALLDQMTDAQHSPQTVLLQPQLIVRGSTAAPRSKTG